MTESGAASVALLGVGLVAAMLGLGVAAGGQYVAGRAAAQTAADAAALAAAPVTFRPYGAAGSPRDEAARFAAANGSRLTSCRCPVNRSAAAREIAVTVERMVDVLFFGPMAVSATSRARFEPIAVFGP